jgi:predicted transcriptional regulator
MKPYCEVIVTTILPAIRSIITKELLSNYNLTQKEAADLLGLTQPAISQYYRESRGFKVKLLEKHPKIMKMIDDLTRDIAAERLDAKEIQAKFCFICKLIRKNKLICSLHEEIYPLIVPFSECPDLIKDK